MVLSMERWVGKVAVVTGVSSGIGAAIAQQLVEAGLKVVGVARRKDRIDALATSLSNQPGKLYPFQADLSKEEDIISAINYAKSIGPIHVLVNNAARACLANLTDGDDKEWKEILELNVIGLSIATREAIKDMRANGIDGHIIHINSLSGHRVIGAFSSMYGATKFAVTALTETLRQELNGLGSKIKISSVSPGRVLTEFSIAAGREAKPELMAMLAKIPALTSEEVADAVTYVLSTPPHVQVHELMTSALY